MIHWKLYTISLLVVIGNMIFLSQALSQDDFYLNPGLRIGHTFGDQGGYTVGFEISYTNFSKRYGFVASLDYCRSAKRIKYHIGGEYLAIEAGPTFINENSTSDFGASMTLYGGLIIIPYYSCTFRFTKDPINELGSFLKIPIRLKGEPFRFGH